MRFHPTRSSSLRRLRTAFSSSSSSSSRSSTPGSSPEPSPAMNQRAWSPASDSSSLHDSPASTHSSGSIREILALRRRPSGVEMELEEEAREHPDEVGLLEPRPEAPPTTRGLFEVLDGSN